MPPASGYTILIDGYNVIKRHAAWAALPLRAGRDQLLQALTRTRWPIPVRQVTVVFDGRQPDLAERQWLGGIEARFARSADAWIQEAIRAHAAREPLAVVTDDGAILNTAKSHRALCYSAAWLAARAGAGKLSARRTATPEQAAGPSAAARRRITEELERRWLS